MPVSRIAHAVLLATLAIASSQCSSTNCNMPADAPWAAKLDFSGTIAIPDDDIPVAVLQLCWGSYCGSTTLPDAGTDGLADAADVGLEIMVSLSNSSWDGGPPNNAAYNFGLSLDRVGVGLYSLSGGNTIVFTEDPDPTGSQTAPTITLTITSGGAVVYQSSPTATCTQVPKTGACSFAYKQCTVQFS